MQLTIGAPGYKTHEVWPVVQCEAHPDCIANEKVELRCAGCHTLLECVTWSEYQRYAWPDCVCAECDEEQARDNALAVTR